jgi:hypothetical protein
MPVLGKPVQYVDITEDDARAVLPQSGMPDTVVHAMLELYAINKAGYTAGTSLVVQLATGKNRLFSVNSTQVPFTM